MSVLPDSKVSVAPIAQTHAGKVRGTFNAGVYAFKGIPYGAATAGANRFLPPQPVSAWSGVRDALDYGPRAPQNERPSALPHLAWIRDTRPYSEQCLVLNVFSPGVRDGGKRPVMVYVHGGGYVSGAGSAPGIDGSNLARRGDVVLVSFNHRLNLFGYLYLGHLAGRYADSGNAGMLDCVAALRWVRENIAEFGGDPDNVTIFGQSGGGSKVAVLMAMPAAQGLFHKAIIQSASSLIRMASREAAERNTHYFLAALGLDQSRLSALAALPVEQLLQAMPAAVKAAGGIDNYRPVVDGRTLATHPFDPVAPSLSARVPLIIGWCETELRFTYSLTPEVYALDDAAVCARIVRLIGIDLAQADALLNVYRRMRPGDKPGDLFALIHTDHMYRRSTTRAAELKSAQGTAPAYMYQFTWKTPVLDGLLRTPHTMCIPFAFGNVDLATGMTGTGQERYALQDRVMGAWLAFARTGDPNHAGLDPWKPYTLPARSTMIFDNACRSIDDPASEERNAMVAQPVYESDALYRR